MGYGDEVIPSSFPQEMTSHLDVINTNISGSCALFRRQNNVGRHDRIAYVGRGNLERVSALFVASTNKLATTFAFQHLPYKAITTGIDRSTSSHPHSIDKNIVCLRVRHVKRLSPLRPPPPPRVDVERRASNSDALGEINLVKFERSRDDVIALRTCVS